MGAYQGAILFRIFLTTIAAHFIDLQLLHNSFRHHSNDQSINQPITMAAVPTVRPV